MSNSERPLSPHLFIYRWPVTMVSSILHRATGIGMSVGFVLFVFWLADAANGSDAYGVFAEAMGSAFGRALLAAWSWAFFYHLANGVRHLAWDTGRGLEKRQATASAWWVIVSSIVLAGGFWAVIL